MEWLKKGGGIRQSVGLQLQEVCDFYHKTSYEEPYFKFSKKLSYGALNRQFLVAPM
jgi:hypothetical protein